MRELCALVGHELNGLEEVVCAAKRLAGLGIRHVLVSLSAEGALYTDGEVTYKADVPELSEIKSTIGAGDAALAGFIIAHDYKYDLKRSLQHLRRRLGLLPAWWKALIRRAGSRWP